MYTQYKIAKKIESYKVLYSVMSFVQHTYKKSVIELRRLDNKFFTVGVRPQVVLWAWSVGKVRLQQMRWNNVSSASSNSSATVDMSLPRT